MENYIQGKRKKINLILIGNFLYPKGMAATRRKQQFIDYFREQNAEVKVLILYQGSNKFRPKNECKGYHKGVYYRIIGNHLGKSLKLLYQFPAFIFQGCKLLSDWKIKNAQNLILSFGFDGFVIIPFLWSKAIGYKIFFDIAEDFSLRTSKSLKQTLYFFCSRLINTLFLNSLIDGLSVVSNHLERKYKKVFRGEIIVIPALANVRQLSTKDKYNDPLTFMYAGSFSNKDGLEIMLSAFKELNKKYSNIRLVLSGSGEPGKIHKLASMVNSPNVQFVGMLPDSEYFRLLDNADVLLMTRVNTGFSNAGFPYKLGEYLGTGNVVICTKTSDIEFYLQDKIDAILIEPENEDELIEAMNYCIENEKTCIDIGKNGQKTCIRYFNQTTNAEALFSMLTSH